MNKTIEALKLAEALENDAKEHREVSYGLDCPPERTANWKHALNCEAAARLIREELAEQSKCACDSPAWCTKYKKCNREILGLPIAEPVKQEPVAYFLDVKAGCSSKPLYEQVPDEYKNDADVFPLYATPVSAKAIRAEALEEVVKFLSESGLITPTGRFAAAIRELE